MSFLNQLIFFIYFSSNFISHIICQDFISCNGFVRSNTSIDFTKVKVQLFTKQGVLKEYIECAPNNGYYLLPVYDKGEYILNVSSPQGWVFQPSDVSLNIDGVNDPCSIGQDINFNFKGYNINGKVTIAGANNGPADVSISLFQEPQLEPLVKTTTSIDGSFSLFAVQPGTYSIVASHPKWYLSKSKTEVTVTNDSVTLKPEENFVLAGYQVSGRVTSDNEPISDVNFILLSSKKNAKVSVSGCETTELSSFPIPKNDLSPICYTKSQPSGQFIFKAVPPGEYYVLAHYKGPGSTKFDVQPSLFKFNVVKDSLNINTVFQVTGFSVQGKVLSKQNGKPLPNVNLILNRKQTAKTNSDGIFTLESVNTGSYHLQIVDPSGTFIFKPEEVKISPNSPVLPTFYPHKFKVCGSVFSSPASSKVSRVIAFSSQAGIIQEFQTDENSGEFCCFLEPGLYTVKVKLNDAEIAAGLQYSPLETKITVTDSPVSAINFSQLKATLRGSIECQQSKCPPIQVLLDSKNLKSPLSTMAEDGQYKFEDLALGTYDVSIDPSQTDWCWKSSSHTVSIVSKSATAPTFILTGINIVIVSSHTAEVSYIKLGEEKKDKPILLSVNAGSSTFCLPSSGEYEFQLGGCHGYASASVRWKSGSGPLTIKALTHAHKIQILSSEATNDLFVNIHYIRDSEVLKKSRLGPLQAESLSGSGKLSYSFELNLTPTEEVEIIPESKTFLISPTSLRVFGKNDCYPKIESFIAEKGIILTGSVTPALPGVLFTIKNEIGDVIDKFITEADGHYRFGPIKAGLSYKISAEKDGYLLTGPDSSGSFKARKLAEVIVTAIDKKTKAPLQGVLIYLSGNGNYRNNGQTDAAGKLSFLSLSPSEYYLRPIMKEYRFVPSSKMVSVNEGATSEIVFSGERVAFSVLGSVVALSGEPEEGVTVEAVGLGSESCAQLVEEATSEAKGLFRIRGLQPQCEYSVGIAKSANSNKHIMKTVPERILIQVKDSDVEDIQLTVLAPTSQTNVIALISVQNSEHLRTLRAKLYRGENMDKALASIKLSNWKWSSYSLKSALITLPSVPMDGGRYLFQLQSSLSQNTHNYSLPSISFQANDSLQVIKVSFDPQPRMNEGELNHNSILVVLILVLLGIAYFKQDQVLNFLIPLSSLRWPSREKIRVISDDNGSDVVTVEPVSVKRKVKPKKQ